MQYQLTDPKTAFVMVGSSGSAKSTWAQDNFNDHEIISLDACRVKLLGHHGFPKVLENRALALFNTHLECVLGAGGVAVFDNTNLNHGIRNDLCEKIQKFGYKIVFVLATDSKDLELCQQRCLKRERITGKSIPISVLEKQHRTYAALDSSSLSRYGTVITTEYTIDRVSAFTVDCPNGALFVEDIHGNPTKLQGAVDALGERMMIQLGDLNDRPSEPDGSMRSMEIMMDLVDAGRARMVIGNHDLGLLKCIQKGSSKGQFEQSVRTYQEFMARDAAFQQRVRAFLESLPHALYVRVPGHDPILVSHAGVPVWEGQLDGTWFTANEYERTTIIKGYKTGEFEVDGKMRVIPVYNLPRQKYIPQCFGHHNASQQETGTFTAPYIVKRGEATYVCLESRLERAPENQLTMFTQPASARPQTLYSSPVIGGV